MWTVRQEEKRRLLRRNNELKNEQVYLEEQDKKLNDTIKVRTALTSHGRPWTGSQVRPAFD